MPPGNADSESQAVVPTDDGDVGIDGESDGIETGGHDGLVSME